MSIKRKRLLPLLFSLVILFTSAMSLIPVPAAAAAFQSRSGDPMETEYIQWKAFGIIKSCFEEDDGVKLGNSNEQGLLNDIFLENQGQGLLGNKADSPGGVYAVTVGYSRNIIDCNTRSEIVEYALKMIDIDNARELSTILEENAGKRNMSAGEARTALTKYMQDSRLGGKGSNGVDDLSEAARYWYWDRVYSWKDDKANQVEGDFSTCGGVFSDNANRGGTTRIGDGRDKFNGFEDSGGRLVPKDYTYAFYELETGRRLAGLDNRVSTSGTNNPTCAEVARAMTPSRRDAYIERFNQARAENPGASVGGGTAGAGASATDGLPADEAECLASGFSGAWIFCPLFNGLSEITEFFYKNILAPFLASPQIDVRPGPNNGFYNAWSNFRFYGNMFLVIAMIIIVFGQSIGGGLIDAYTAKKVMPRILAAAIMINLSIYIIAVLIDITNIIGAGIVSLIFSPFEGLGYTLNVTQLLTLTGGGALALFLGGGGAYGFISAAVGGGFSQMAVFVGLVVIVPVLLAVLAVIITLIIRRALIWGLLLMSPVAFALYCLPNTEKYFRKWWDLLLKALLVYPIIMAIFAISSVTSILVLGAADPGNAGAAGGAAGAVSTGGAALVALFLQIIPLFLIPFAFKFAGGAIGSLYAAIQGGSQKAGGMLKSRQDIARGNAKQLSLQARQRGYDRLGSFGDRNRVFRPGARFLQNRVGGYNLHGALAEATAATFKEMDAQKDTGIDDEQRALTVNKAWARANDATGGTHWRRNANGAMEYRTLGGRWVSESAVDAAHGRWGGDMAAMQWALGYEMSKAATQEEMDYLFNNYERVNGPGSGLNLDSGQMNGMWVGAAFAKQNTDRQYKHYAWNGENRQLRMNPTNLMREIDERQGNWAMMSQSADTWTTMSEEVNRARRVLNGTATPEEQGQMNRADAMEVLQRGARIARSVGGSQPIRDPKTGQPMRNPDGSIMMSTSVGQGASGRTKEEMENYYSLFDDGRGGIMDYTREFGTERRSSRVRSGINPMGRPANDQQAPSMGSPDNFGADQDPQRNPPRSAGRGGRG